VRTFGTIPIIAGLLAFAVAYFSRTTSSKVDESGVFIGLGVLIVSSALLGVYTVTKNFQKVCRRMVVLGEITRALYLIEANIVPEGVLFRPRKSTWDVFVRLSMSYRFPLIIFYAVMAAIGWFLVFEHADLPPLLCFVNRHPLWRAFGASLMFSGVTIWYSFFVVRGKMRDVYCWWNNLQKTRENSPAQS